MVAISRVSSGMPLPASIRLSGASSVERNTVRPCRPPPCGSVSCRGCGFAASAAPCRRPPARTSRTARSFPACPLGSRKVKPLQAARLLAQHHPLQHVEEGERAFQHRLVRTHWGEDVVHLCDRAQDARRVHRARQVEEEQVVAAFRRQLPCRVGACSTRHLRTG